MSGLGLGGASNHQGQARQLTVTDRGERLGQSLVRAIIHGEVDMRPSWYGSKLLARLIIPEDRILFTSFHVVKAFEVGFA